MRTQPKVLRYLLIRAVFSAWADPWADLGQTPMVFGQTPSEDCVAHGTPTAQNNQELVWKSDQVIPL